MPAVGFCSCQSLHLGQTSPFPPQKPSFPAQCTSPHLPPDSFGATFSTFLFWSPLGSGLPKLAESTPWARTWAFLVTPVPRPPSRGHGSGSYSGLGAVSFHRSTRCQCGAGHLGTEKQERRGTMAGPGSTVDKRCLEGSRIQKVEGGGRGLHRPIYLPLGKVAKWVLGLGRHWPGCQATSKPLVLSDMGLRRLML